ncbi:MAG TPA: lysophospholipid acyltransferase family protein [Hyphomicrobiales bacterium]|nr:lysophospholipid acyltransferase family protein [Hyphomicrobiales bacterium]
MGKILANVRAGIFYLGYSLTLVVWGPLCVLLAPLLPLKGRYRMCLMWNHFALWWLGLVCGLRYKVEGPLPTPGEPVVVLSNHQSPWETLFLVQFFEPICPILKIELLSIPFFGWGLRQLQPIAIDRSKRREARDTLLTQGQDRLARGLSVLVFPEGTRVDPGQARKFSSGGAELAIASGASIVPVMHDAGCFWPAHHFGKRVGTITVQVGPPIPSIGRDARELTEEVSRWIKTRFDALHPELSGEAADPSDVEIGH